jgi:hypothetical protein
LRAPSHNLYHPGKLADTNNTAIVTRDIANVSHTIKGQKVMLTHRVKGDVFENHHFTVSLFETYDQLFPRVLVNSPKKLGVHLSHTLWGTYQTLPFRVFANGPNN